MVESCRIARPADAGLARRLPAFPASLLPVCNIDSLLEQLAQFWLDQSSADGVLIAVLSTTERCIHERYQDAEGSGQRLELSVDVETGLDTLAALRSAARQFIEPDRCAGDISLRWADAVIGLIQFKGGPPRKDTCCDQAVEGTTALLLQGLALIERDARQNREWQHRKLEALAEFAAGAGHEINNPLAVIANRAHALMASESDPQRRRDLALIGGQAYRIRDMIGDAMLFARPPRPNAEELDMARIVTQSVDRLRPAFDEQNCRLTLSAPTSVPVWADSVQLSIVAENLLHNARHAAGAGGQVEADVATVNGDAVLTVTDNGPGLTEKDRQHLYDPFYSGRPAGRGLGFGLSKCWRIVNGHGGHIDVESVAGRTRFSVFWPQVAPAEKP